MTQEQETRLAEVEVCMRRYFNMNIRPMMVSVKREIDGHKGAEQAAFMASSTARIQAITTNDPFATAWGQQAYLRQTGEWNSKTTDDYLAMCRENLETKDFAEDLTTLSRTWRQSVIDIIGREAYDEKSQALGGDLADMYVSYRMEGMMMDHLARQRMPKSTMDYVLGKALDESLVGTLFTMQNTTPVDEQIGERAEDMYGPSMKEKASAIGLSFGMDAACTYGFSSWASLGRLAKGEVLCRSALGIYDYFTDGGERSVEEQISQGVFGKEKNFLSQIQSKAAAIDPNECSFAYEVDEHLHKPLCVMTEEDRRRYIRFYPEKPDFQQYVHMGEEEAPEVHVPFIPGYDPTQEHEIQTEYHTMSAKPQTQQQPQPVAAEEGNIVLEEEVAAPPQQSSDGWGDMLSATGLDGLGSVGRNLGYVVSMLPDVLVGLFNGKTRGLGLKDNMLPIASILVGLFVRNPLLKTVLIGMGGLNLFNKAGKEALEDQKIKDGIIPQGHTQYRQYADEPLNPRMQGVEIKGNSLFATVDGIPCTVQLPASAIAAHQAGALPLNTLANAVLAKSDEISRLAQENYEERETREVGHSRGI